MVQSRAEKALQQVAARKKPIYELQGQISDALGAELTLRQNADGQHNYAADYIVSISETDKGFNFAVGLHFRNPEVAMTTVHDGIRKTSAATIAESVLEDLVKTKHRTFNAQCSSDWRMSGSAKSLEDIASAVNSILSPEVAKVATPQADRSR